MAFALAGLLVAAGASAQATLAAAEAIQLTLDDAVRRAVENNPDLAVVQLATEVEAARVGQSRSAFAPVFSTAVGRSSDVLPPTNSLLGEEGVGTDEWFSSTGVRQRVPWFGGTWSASWDTSRISSTNPLTSFDPNVQSGFQVAFSQPLLRDRTMDAARHQFIIARRNQEISEIQFRESAVQTVAAVKQAYWTLKAAQAHVTVQQRSLELADELVRQNRARVDVGQTAPLDLVQAEAEAASRRESLIVATAAAGDAEDRLRRLIMDPSDTTFWQTRLNPVDDASAIGPMPDVEAAVAKALGQRHDLARARLQLSNASTNMEFFSSQALPDVRFETSYRGSGLGGTQFLRTGPFPGTVTGSLTRGYGSVLNQIFTNDYPSWSFGVTVNYPIGQSYEEAGLARADIERRQTAQRIASLELQTVETIRQSGRQVRSTAERVDAAQAGANFAQQRLDAEQRRFEVGLSTSFLVTQAQRDSLLAQVNLLQATLDHQSSLVSFEALQQAPALGAADAIGVSGASVVLLPPPAPRGMFRQGGGAFLQ
jgi:HAE1 family hydrophobic/amphiphilic exporter-1